MCHHFCLYDFCHFTGKVVKILNKLFFWPYYQQRYLNNASSVYKFDLFTSLLVHTNRLRVA